MLLTNVSLPNCIPRQQDSFVKALIVDSVEFSIIVLVNWPDVYSPNLAKSSVCLTTVFVHD